MLGGDVCAADHVQIGFKPLFGFKRKMSLLILHHDKGSFSSFPLCSLLFVSIIRQRKHVNMDGAKWVPTREGVLGYPQTLHCPFAKKNKERIQLYNNYLTFRIIVALQTQFLKL